MGAMKGHAEGEPFGRISGLTRHAGHDVIDMIHDHAVPAGLLFGL